mgnify:CR=1 FL=1
MHSYNRNSKRNHKKDRVEDGHFSLQVKGNQNTSKKEAIMTKDTEKKLKNERKYSRKRENKGILLYKRNKELKEVGEIGVSILTTEVDGKNRNREDTR